MADIQKITEEISSLTLLEARDLVKALEEKLGIKAAASMAVAAMAVPGAAAEAAPAEEKPASVPDAASEDKAAKPAKGPVPQLVPKQSPAH